MQMPDVTLRVHRVDRYTPQDVFLLVYLNSLHSQDLLISMFIIILSLQ